MIYFFIWLMMRIDRRNYSFRIDMSVLWRNFIMTIIYYFVLVMIMDGGWWRSLRSMKPITSINGWGHFDIIIYIVIIVLFHTFGVSPYFMIWNEVWVFLWNKGSWGGVSWIIFEKLTDRERIILLVERLRIL